MSDTFTIEKLDGTKVQLKFNDPTADDLTQANKLHSKTFADGVTTGGLLRKQLSEHLKAKGLWSDQKQAELDTLQKEITQKEYALHKGGTKVGEGRTLALDIKLDRAKQAELLSDYTAYDNETVEGAADNARFNYMVYATTVYNENGQRYFGSYDEFVTYSDPVSFEAANKYAKKFYNLNESFETTLPENKFLKKFNFIDEELRLINKEGKLVDEKGRLLDELGNLLDEDGNRVDNYGYKRTDDGEFADESNPFLDDDGNPIVVDSEADTEESVPKMVEETEPVSAEDSA